MEALSKWIVRHRLWVGLTWLAITIVGVLVAPSVSGRLQSGIHMNSAAVTANEQIAKQYGGVAAVPGVLVINFPAGTTVDTPGTLTHLHGVDSALAKAAPSIREISYASTGNRALVGTGGTSTVVMAFSPTAGNDIPTTVLDQLSTAAGKALPGASVHATGLTALASGSSASGKSSVFTELLIGGLGALIILAWVFGSFLALLPLIMALVSVLTMQLLIYGLSFLMPSDIPFNPAVQFIVALLGLGLSVDYSLLVVNRWREERAAGKSNTDAVHAAMHRAGHAVWFSGLTASLGLFALAVVPVSLVRGIGIAGLFIPSTATLVALTLLPVMLSKVGPKMDWPHRKSAGSASRFWTRWSHLVIRHRVAAAVTGLAILFGLGGAALTLNIAEPTSTALSNGGSYADGLHALQADGFPTGTLTPIPVWVPPGIAGQTVAGSLSQLSSVHGAIAPAGGLWQQGGSSMVMVLPNHETGTSQAGTSLADVQHTVPRGALVGGDAAQKVDAVHNTYSAFPYHVPAGRDRHVPAAGPRVTVDPAADQGGAAQRPVRRCHLRDPGVGVAARVRHPDAVGCAGHRLGGHLGTDSAVRVPVRHLDGLRGFHLVPDAGRPMTAPAPPPPASSRGYRAPDAWVTSAALILFFALASLATTNDITVRQLASGMAAGVLLDAVVVRMLLLPALVSLFGKANWWMPSWAARLLRLPPAGPVGSSSLEEHVPVGVGQA